MQLTVCAFANYNKASWCLFSAGKQTISCEFQDPFICGYTTSAAGTISWEHLSGDILGGLTTVERGMCVCMYVRLTWRYILQCDFFWLERQCTMKDDLSKTNNPFGRCENWKQFAANSHFIANSQIAKYFPIKYWKIIFSNTLLAWHEQNSNTRTALQCSSVSR